MNNIITTVVKWFKKPCKKKLVVMQKPIYVIKPEYENKINWNYLSANPSPAAIYLLEKCLETNRMWSPRAQHLSILSTSPKKVNWHELSGNPAAIHLLEQNPEKIDWDMLSSNPAAIHLLKKCLEINPKKINWLRLSNNSAAVHLIEKSLDQNPETKNCRELSRILATVYLLEKCSETNQRWSSTNPEKIDWEQLSGNPNAVHIFAKLDYQKMRENMRPVAEELASKIFHPLRVQRVCSLYNCHEIEYLDLLS